MRIFRTTSVFLTALVCAGGLVGTPVALGLPCTLLEGYIALLRAKDYEHIAARIPGKIKFVQKPVDAIRVVTAKGDTLAQITYMKLHGASRPTIELLSYRSADERIDREMLGYLLNRLLGRENIRNVRVTVDSETYEQEDFTLRSSPLLQLVAEAGLIYLEKRTLTVNVRTGTETRREYQLYFYKPH